MISTPLKNFRLPHKEDWEWYQDWYIDKSNQFDEVVNKDKHHDSTYDEDGWQYAVSFDGQFSGQQTAMSYVRRRRWVRLAQKKVFSSEKKVQAFKKQRQTAISAG